MASADQPCDGDAQSAKQTSVQDPGTCLLVRLAVGVIRQFQSETNAITEASEPQWARITVFTLAGLFAERYRYNVPDQD